MASGMRHSPITLPALPAELLIEIFEATDSFPTALALSKTCHRLHSIWTSNANVILPSVVECFPQAQKLATTQEKAAQRQPHAHSTSLAHPGIPITTNQRISQNASEASRILQTFETDVVSRHSQNTSLPRCTPLTPTERTSFLNGFYLALTYLTVGRSLPFLSPLPLLSYMQMFEAMRALASDRLLLSPVRSPETKMTASETFFGFIRFHAELTSFANRAFPSWPDEQNRWDKAPDGYFTLDDGYRAKVDGGRGEGPLLGDLLKVIARITIGLGGEVE